VNVTIIKEPLTEPDMSPAYRAVECRIFIDSRLTVDEQLHAAFFEIVSAWFDPHEDAREQCCHIAGQLLDAHRGITSVV